MTLEEACHKLNAEMGPRVRSDVQAIGVGADAIHVFLKGKSRFGRTGFPTSYEGWPVKAKVCGEFRIGGLTQ